MKTKEHLITDYFMSIVTARDKKLFLETQCASSMGSGWLHYHTVYCTNPHKALQTLHFPCECICAFLYVLPIPWSSYIQTLGTCVHEIEALEITELLLRVSEEMCWGFQELVLWWD